MRQILPWVDMVHGNVRELSRFADAPDLDTALQRITAWGAAAVVVHLGAAGAGYACRGQWTTAPAVPVHSHKNTTGTGDVLSVCMMLMHDRDDIPLNDRLRLANAIVAEFIEGKRAVIPVLE